VLSPDEIDQVTSGEPAKSIDQPRRLTKILQAIGSRAEKRNSGSQWTPHWREMDSKSWYRGTKAVDFRSIPGIAGVSAGLVNDTT
jgi:hypothetical protein